MQVSKAGVFRLLLPRLKKLAERSQAAAKAINELSGQSVANSQKTGKTISEMLYKIDNTAKLIKEIATSMSGQDSTIHQISSSIEQLNTISQQNAGIASQLADTAIELKHSSAELTESMG